MMDWLEMSVTVSPELAEPLAELFQRHSQTPIVIEERNGYNPDEGEEPPRDGPVTVCAYVRDTPAGRRRRAHIEVGLRLLRLIAPLPELQERRVAAEGWEQAWKAHFPVVRIGQRIVVRPPWLPYAGAGNDVVISLEPGGAFGTGHHPTTRMCLEALERYVRPEATVLDVGTGAGILAIAAVGLGARHVLALDTYAVAVRIARRNARANAAGRRVAVRHGRLPLEARGAAFDLVVANISATVVGGLAPHLLAAVAPGGVLIASGILEDRRDEVVEKLREAGLQVIEERRDGDWVALVFRAASSLTPGSARSR